ncbi:uncharacterized protein MONBRDRAFT_34288 [Monosiga brevicollis MX1]|uniref:Uncharacterized protein n=1 Tax=Monosiga brevicollis TaxID=81824 RepID=A9VAR0_MONBE|nr:uncharacterized protein MONBRDRAFT_34288 [Monosiga brevicollis MX1]EDQ85418.1 predicted protein [Monosiga brevicollis MX1]|eukprot:XP_001749829.1 hypothetical protein [Monosiga brevicollis MX1]
MAMSTMCMRLLRRTSLGPSGALGVVQSVAPGWARQRRHIHFDEQALTQESQHAISEVFDNDQMRMDLLDQHMFVGTVQHFGVGAEELHPHANRFVVCQMGGPYDDQVSPIEIVDFALVGTMGRDVLHDTLMQLGAASVMHGEMNAIHTDPWQLGFGMGTLPVVFDGQGTVLRLGQRDGRATLELPRLQASVELSQIRDVRGQYDPETLTVQTSLQLEDGSMLSLFRDEAFAHNRDVERDLATPELAMYAGEFSIKVLGTLVGRMASMGAPAQLLLSRLLMSEHNPYVSQRQQEWRSALAHYAEQSSEEPSA